MPLHFPLARNHQRRKSEDHPPYISPSPARTITASSTASSAPSDSAPSGILQNGKPQSSASGSSSQSGSSRHITKRMSGLSTFDRTDTISSTQDSDDERDGTRRASSSTPATSVSSLNNQCPLPQSSASGKFPFVMMTLSSSSTLSFIALPLAMRPVVLEAVNKAWKRGVSKTGQVEYQRELMERHRDKGCEGGVWEVNLKDTCWMPSSQDKVS